MDFDTASMFRDLLFEISKELKEANRLKKVELKMMLTDRKALTDDTINLVEGTLG